MEALVLEMIRYGIPVDQTRAVMNALRIGNIADLNDLCRPRVDNLPNFRKQVINLRNVDIHTRFQYAAV
jgi:hypothetical protein